MLSRLVETQNLLELKNKQIQERIETLMGVGAHFLTLLEKPEAVESIKDHIKLIQTADPLLGNLHEIVNMSLEREPFLVFKNDVTKLLSEDKEGQELLSAGSPKILEFLTLTRKMIESLQKISKGLQIKINETAQAVEKEKARLVTEARKKTEDLQHEAALRTQLAELQKLVKTVEERTKAAEEQLAFQVAQERKRVAGEEKARQKNLFLQEMAAILANLAITPKTNPLEYLPDFAEKLKSITFLDQTTALQDAITYNVTKIEEKLVYIEQGLNMILASIDNQDAPNIKMINKLLLEVQQKREICQAIPSLAPQERDLLNLQNKTMHEKETIDETPLVMTQVEEGQQTRNKPPQAEKRHLQPTEKIVDINPSSPKEEAKLGVSEFALNYAELDKEVKRLENFKDTFAVKKDAKKIDKSDHFTIHSHFNNLMLSLLPDIRNGIDKSNSNEEKEKLNTLQLRATALIPLYSSQYAKILDEIIKKESKGKKDYLKTLEDKYIRDMSVQQKEALAIFLLENVNQHLLAQERGLLGIQFRFNSHSMQTLSMHKAMKLLVPEHITQKKDKKIELQLNNKTETFTRHTNVFKPKRRR